MSDSASALRRPLALTATIATSVAAAAGLVAPAANATTASPNGTANLTVSGGSTAAPSASSTVTGTKYALGFAPHAQNLAWAPTGARAAWIDPATNAVVAGVPGGAAEVIAPAPGAGTVRSHPAWIDGGSKVVWSEKAGSSNAVLNWAYGNGIQGAGGAPTVQRLQTLAGSDLYHPDSVGSLLVYQVNTPGKAPQIYLWNRAGSAAPVAIAAGWSPSISADGTHVAFVDNTASPAGTNVYTVALSNPAGTLKQVTASAKPFRLSMQAMSMSDTPRCCRWVSTPNQKLAPSLSATYMPNSSLRPSALMPRILYTQRLTTRPSSLTL